MLRQHEEAIAANADYFGYPLSTSIARPLIAKKAAETGKTASGLEMGKNFFSLRSVRPVSYQGKMIGYLEVAEEIVELWGKGSGSVASP